VTDRQHGLARDLTNRDVYERGVREPMRLLVETLDARLSAIAPEIVGDPERSMFRIHRDVRFSILAAPVIEVGILTQSRMFFWM
jgi:uncharacterized protein (DUF2461 family)